jgi:drug/metabolite transporter (DMT)-like permease
VGSLLAFASALAYSCMYFLVRSGVRKGDPDGGAFITTLINVLMLAAAVLLVTIVAAPPDWDPTGIFWFAVAGMLGTFSGRILLFAGLRRIGPVRAASLTNTAPVVTIGAAVVLLGERLSPAALVAVVLVLIGLGILTWEAFQMQGPGGTDADAEDGPVVKAPSSETGPVVAPANDRRSRVYQRMGTPAVLGLLFAGLSAVSFGLARVARRVGLDEMPDPLIGSLVGATIALASSLLLQAGQGRVSSVVLASVREVRWRLWLAGVCSTIGLLTFFIAIQLAPLAHVAVIAASETIPTLIIGSLIMRKSERLSIRIAIPALCVFAAGVLIALS